MAINPYTTAAKYTYMPIPFREMMYAGAAADKRTASLLANAEKYNSTLPHWDGDEDAAKKLFDNKEKVKQDLINNFHKDYGNYAEVSRDLMNLASREKRLGGPEYELYKRLQQANKYKENLKDSGWEGREKNYSLSTLDAEPFQNYTEAEGAGDVTGAPIPKYMSGDDMQKAMNTMLAPMKSELLGIYSDKEIEKMTGTELINAFGISTGKTQKQIAEDMANMISPDLIAAAQHYSDTDTYYDSLSQDNPKEWFNNNRINQGIVYDWEKNKPTDTILGNMIGAISDLAANSKLNIKEGKKSAADKATAAEKAKLYKEAMPENEQTTFPYSPSTPKQVLDILHGENGESGLLADIANKKHIINTTKDKNSNKYIGAVSSLNLLESKERNLRLALNKFEDQLSDPESINYNEDYAVMKAERGSEFEAEFLKQNINNYEEIVNPEFKSDSNDKVIEIAESLNNGTLLRYSDEFYEKLATGNKSGREVYNDLSEDEKNYLANNAKYAQKLEENIKKEKEILEEYSEVITDAKDNTGTFIITPMPLKYKRDQGLLVKDKQYDAKWADYIVENQSSFIIMDDKGKVINDEADPDAQKDLLWGVYDLDKKNPGPSVQFIGVTGPSIDGAENPPMLALNVHSGKTGTTDKSVIERYYAIPKGAKANQIWENLANDYKIISSDEGGAGAKQAANDMAETLNNLEPVIAVQKQLGHAIMDNNIPERPKYTTDKEGNSIPGVDNYTIDLTGGNISQATAIRSGNQEIDYSAITDQNAVITQNSDGVVTVIYRDYETDELIEDSWGGGLVDNGQAWRNAVLQVAQQQKVNTKVATISREVESYATSDSFKKVITDKTEKEQNEILMDYTADKVNNLVNILRPNSDINSKNELAYKLMVRIFRNLKDENIIRGTSSAKTGETSSN
jgi:hypothetical protein